MNPARYWPRTADSWTLSAVISGIARSTLTFSSWTLRLSKRAGGSIATRLRHLEDVVLDDVAQRAALVVVAAAVLDAQVLGDGDLDVVDVAAVPDRLEDRVGEPQHQQVLDGLLAEVMIDAVGLALAEDRPDAIVEGACAREVRPERLLDHDPAEGVVVFTGQPGVAELLGDQREELGRRRQVEQAIPEPPGACGSAGRARRAGRCRPPGRRTSGSGSAGVARTRPRCRRPARRGRRGSPPPGGPPRGTRRRSTRLRDMPMMFMSGGSSCCRARL